MTDAEKYARAQQMIATAVTAVIGQTVGQLDIAQSVSTGAIVCEALRDVLQNFEIVREAAAAAVPPEVSEVLLRMLGRKAVW